ncbi:putative tRNA threonylcarbamoyladenosine biosynthesis protein Osgepl1 [Dufourea novaeangliae]|uniref:N(6)-L-threonylcarbamoyladenine synthase n=2 Tax=Dufourea novaeangliae TaxID=178035 RepID=A0A154P9X6_DUFNO|nr:putative tRNA threonylcarbamoyladenosine biosynthesis protein Osgepl1 [Dufourea novaeangliae]
MHLFYKCPLKHFFSPNILLYPHRNDLKLLKNNLHNKAVIVLGIESSCDDTGCGIVDNTGTILGEAIDSQHYVHLNFGGIIPGIARVLHTNNITRVCEDALRSANLKLKDISAIATTVKPGLPMSLDVGTRFGKHLAKIGKKPFIPIHHMEAHALTVRMKEKVDFPYLVLLVSGGHCLLAIVEDVNKFYLLGTTINIAPGEIFDKVARRLKLRNVPEFSSLNGGAAIETAARKASNVDQFFFDTAMAHYRNCNFSLSGMLTRCTKYIETEEEKHGVIGDMLIPDAYNLCAAFQLAVVTHICQRTQRAIEFVDKMSLFPNDKRTLVVSGGVACNDFLAKALNIVSTELGFNFVRPPPKLCTDNGIMIAWNGVERWIADKGVIKNENDIDNVCIEKKAPLGEDWREKVKEANLKCNWVKLKKQLT